MLQFIVIFIQILKKSGKNIYYPHRLYTRHYDVTTTFLIEIIQVNNINYYYKRMCIYIKILGLYTYYMLSILVISSSSRFSAPPLPTVCPFSNSRDDRQQRHEELLLLLLLYRTSKIHDGTMSLF